MEHTSWELEERGIVAGTYVAHILSEPSEHGTKLVIAEVYNPETARLIAGAPDLLGALQDIIQMIEMSSMQPPADVGDSIRVFGKPAIAKATGA